MSPTRACLIAAALAATPLAARAGGTLAIVRPETATTGVLEVTSRAFDPNAPIPIMYARQGKSISPPLTWGEHPPKATKSFVVLAEDADAAGAAPFVQWVLFDLGNNASGLPRAVKVAPEPKNAQGARQGRNDLGTVGYSGPMPPETDPPHRYHFEVFALDRLLKLKAGARRDEVVRAMSGHVLAKGELVGSYQYRALKPEIPAVTPQG